MKLQHRHTSSHISHFCANLLEVTKRITFVEGSQASAACPCDRRSVEIKIIMEFWSNDTSSSIGTTAHCGLWPVEKCPSIFSYLPPTLSIFSLPALEDLFLLPLSPSSRLFQFLSEDLFVHPILLHSLYVT